MTNYARGIDAETKASWYLQTTKMFLLIQSRCHTPHGEIDLIMQDGDTLVAVEVKSRQWKDSLKDCLSTRQIKRCVMALQWYNTRCAMMDKNKNIPIQFQNLRLDFVFVHPDFLMYVENILCHQLD